MKKFFFRLETPLKLKIQEEDRQKLVVAAAGEEYETHLACLTALNAELAGIQTKLRQAQGTPEDLGQGQALDLHLLSVIQDYLPVLLAKIHRQQEKVALAMSRLEEARQELVRIRQDRKVLEKLKNKALIQYHRELLREEQKTLDELAVSGFIRGNGS